MVRVHNNRTVFVSSNSSKLIDTSKLGLTFSSRFDNGNPLLLRRVNKHRDQRKTYLFSN